MTRTFQRCLQTLLLACLLLSGQALSEDARARMDAAFSTAGITPGQYLEIAQAAQTDTALRERIGEMLEE